MSDQGDQRRHAARTTIVGGQPPGNARDIPPVPLGLEQVLQMAAASPEFEAQLLTDREAAVAAANVTLTAHEWGMLRAVNDRALRTMIAGVDQRLAQSERRAFLEHAAAALAVLVGGAAVAGCDGKTGERERVDHSQKATGARPDRPERPPAPPPTATGARPDRPPGKPAGSRPDRPRPDAGTPKTTPPKRRSNGIGGIRPRKERMPVDTGIRTRPENLRTGTGSRPGND